MYDELDSSDAEFAAKKAGYENINRLFDQLDASADLVDAEAVAGVHELLDWGMLVNGTIIAADSEDAAVETLYGEDSAFADEVPADDTGRRVDLRQLRRRGRRVTDVVHRAAFVATALAASAVVAGCGGESIAPPEAHAATPAPATSVVAPASIPIVVDYSPTLSDVTALLYLASDPAVDLLAVTLAGTGESRCDAAGPNTSRCSSWSVGSTSRSPVVVPIRSGPATSGRPSGGTPPTRCPGSSCPPRPGGRRRSTPPTSWRMPSVDSRCRRGRARPADQPGAGGRAPPGVRR